MKIKAHHYRFCSICGGRLEPKSGNLHCAKCDFINYQNPRPTVTALILNRGKILLVKKKQAPFKGWWDLPGGFVDKGEHPGKTLARELKEELGISVKRKKFFGLYTGTYPSPTDPFFILSAVYVVKPKPGKVGISDKGELKDLGWFSRKDLPPKIAFDSNRRALKDFLKIWS